MRTKKFQGSNHICLDFKFKQQVLKLNTKFCYYGPGLSAAVLASVVQQPVVDNSGTYTYTHAYVTTTVREP